MSRSVPSAVRLVIRATTFDLDEDLVLRDGTREVLRLRRSLLVDDGATVTQAHESQVSVLIRATSFKTGRDTVILFDANGSEVLSLPDDILCSYSRVTGSDRS